MQKFIRLPVLCLAIFSSYVLYSIKPCECGSQASGSVTTYNVGDGEGCCSGTAGATGFILRYVPDEGTTYTLSGVTQITGSQAQSICCPHS